MAALFSSNNEHKEMLISSKDETVILMGKVELMLIKNQ
jgi:hypothetical protein